MSRQVLELEAVLQQLVVEHGKLLKHVEAQQAAMKAFNTNAMHDLLNLQEASRLRIAGLENKRRQLTQLLARAMRMEGEPKIQRLAELYPQRAVSLLTLRTQLKDVMSQIARRTTIASKVASAVSGHLNTVVRLLAGAVERAGLYTKQGVPKVSARIGVMEAVG